MYSLCWPHGEGSVSRCKAGARAGRALGRAGAQSLQGSPLALGSSRGACHLHAGPSSHEFQGLD